MVDLGTFYRVSADNRDLNYDKYFADGNDTGAEDIGEFNSDNTTRLDVEAVKNKLLSLDYVQEALREYRKGAK